MAASDKASRFQLFLRCRRRLHPDLALRPDETVFLGRSPQTGIRDRRLSRKQLRLVAAAKGSVSVEQLGGNSSTVAGRLLEVGQTAQASPGDTICLLEGQYPYVLKLVQEPEAEEERGTPPKVKMEERKPSASGHWSRGLLTAMEDPELVVQSDKEAVVIRDKYPKARHHYLVLPRERIDRASELHRRHLPLLRHLRQVGERLAGDRHPECEFRLGYHARPSMGQLHLHVVSQDFVSDALKTKRHWNSFNTEFFVPAAEVERQLEEEGRVREMAVDRAKELLGKELQCHKCNYRPKNMPDLKNHLLRH